MFAAAVRGGVAALFLFVELQGAVHGFDGVVLEAESDVGVGVSGDAYVGVAEEFFDGDQFDALFEQECGAGVPEVVESDAADSGVVAQGVEAA